MVQPAYVYCDTSIVVDTFVITPYTRVRCMMRWVSGCAREYTTIVTSYWLGRLYSKCQHISSDSFKVFEPSSIARTGQNVQYEVEGHTA